jgi:hypothetical protein
MKEVPVDVKYYLYSSGEISILEIDYIPWEYDKDTPQVYESNELFKQLGGGTNSDAIADVITEQLSDKWLNIIVTDGDLNSLMQRENIHSLLKNVLVISVHSDLPDNLLGISIRQTRDIEGGSDGERWIGRVELSQRLGLRLSGQLFYQYEDNDGGPGSFTEHVTGLSLRRYF